MAFFHLLPDLDQGSLAQTWPKIILGLEPQPGSETMTVKEEEGRRVTLVGELGDTSQSALTKYRRIFVGSDSTFEFIKYEILTFFLSSLPGAVGLVMRRSFYPKLFAGIGPGTVIGCQVTLRCPRVITLGASNIIDDNVVLDAKGDASSIALGDSVLLGRNSIVSCSSARIEIGDEVSIGPNCFIRAGICPVSIGSSVTIGAQSSIVSGNPGHERTDIPIKDQAGDYKGIKIGDGVWIGVGATIIDGVSIGDHAIVGAGAVVTRDVLAYSKVAGVPAKVLGTRMAEKETLSPK
jgi:acetyltransferase-like isoleucine patch superfamily enzyme